MADSDAVRSRRKRFHAAGDHRYCRRCAALRAQVKPAPMLDLDPVAELRATAARLIAAHEADPANAIVARELRLTLLAIPAEEPADLMGELRGLAAKVS